MPSIDKDAKIPCPTPQHLQTELETLTSTLELGEKEDTWEKLERALIRFAGVTRGGGYKHVPMFVEGVGRQGNGLKIVACMMSDRGRLSGTAIDLLQTMAPRLGSNFAPLVSIYMDPIIRLLARPNKVVLKRTDKCLTTILTHCHLTTIVFELRKGLSDEAATCRRGCATAIERTLESWEKEIWGEKGVVTLEEIIRKIAVDKDAEVRQTAKNIWALFTSQWPERVEDFTAPLTPTTRRRLDISGTSSQAGPSKPKPASRTMGPPPPPHRPASTTSTASAGTTQNAKTTHQRVKSSSTHPSRPHDPPVRNPAPYSAPASPTKERDLPSISKSIGSSSRPEGLGLPSRSVSQNPLPSSTWSHPISPEKKEVWSRPHRPHIPTSYSALSLTTDPSDSSRQPRRFPPPAKVTRSANPVGDAEDHVFGSGLFPAAGPSVLRGPVKIPQHPSQPVSKLGPAQRRVVTAPILHTTRTNVQSAPGPSEAEATLRGTRSVKKRVEELEEEIRTKSQPSSPVVIPMPSPQHTAHLSPLASKKIALSSGGSDSPFLPVLLRSTASRGGHEKDAGEDNEDLRTVQREADEGNMTILDTTQPGPDCPPDAVASRRRRETSEAAPTEGPEAEMETGDGLPVPATGHSLEMTEAPPLNEPSANSEALDGLGSAIQEDFAPEVAEEQTADGAADDSQHEMEETMPDKREEDMGESAQREDVKVGTTATDMIQPQSAKAVEVEERNVHDATESEVKDEEEPLDLARQVPLPGSPAAAPDTLPEVEAVEPLPAPVVVPKANWPKEPPPRPRIVSQNTGSRNAAAESTGATRRAAVPRKPAVPPPVRVKAPTLERKTFKPTTAASRAATAKPPGPASAPKTALSSSTASASGQSAPMSTSTKADSTKPASNIKASAPVAARVNPGKTSTAPAVISRPMSASGSSTTLRAASTVPPKPPVPKVVPSKTTKADSSKPTARPVDNTSAAASTGVRPAVKQSAQVAIPPVRQEKIRRKAPLPSFKPVRAKDKESSAGPSTSAKGRLQAGLTVSTGATLRARVKPETVPLPMSPSEKAKLPPKDIPLPRSPVRPSYVLEHGTGEYEADACDGDESIYEEPEPVEDKEPLGEYADIAENVAEHMAMVTQRIEEPASTALHPVAQPSSLKSSPILVSQPRALSPVLTTTLSPASPTPAALSTAAFENVSATATVPQNDHESFRSPLASRKLVDAPSPGEIPSPFLNAAGRPFKPSLFPRNHYASPDSKSTTAPAEDSSSEDGEDLDRLTTTLGQEKRSAGTPLRPRQVPSGGPVETGADLMELSASSRPAHGERKDVSTPGKAAEMMLAKIAGINATPKDIASSPNLSARVALSMRDANEGA